MTRRTPLLVLPVLVLAALAGCANDADTGGGKGFITRDGQITEIAPDGREPVGEVSGRGLDGEPLDLDDFAGKVVVVNVWGSWCTPCRKEAPDLVAAANELTGPDVAFLGINTRDPAVENALGFVRTYDVPYPSIFDQGGKTLLAFGRPLVIPTTVVVDREGRVAATILGELPSRTTVTTIVERVVAEDADG